MKRPKAPPFVFVALSGEVSVVFHPASPPDTASSEACPPMRTNVTGALFLNHACAAYAAYVGEV